MPTKIGDLELYTVEDLAAALQMNKRNIRAMLHEGKLKARKMGKRWYVTADTLKEYFNQADN